MVLLIDNWDSFVYNLARYVEELGYCAHVVRTNAITLQDIKKLNPSSIILSPGPCSPLEAGISIEVVNCFYKTIPILGVCLGHQVIAHAFGGQVGRARYPLHGKSAKMTHTQDGIFLDLPNPLQVARYHSLIAQSLPSCLRTTAWSEEGEIMALQHIHYPTFGVQFHPESILTEYGYDIVNQFLKIKF